jgi:DNA replication and repair protein RecF
MHLSKISFEQFRCYVRQELELPAAGVRLAGSNASGKTSFVEGVQLLSMMKSARASVERELINWSSNQEFGLPPYARVSGEVVGSPNAETIEVSLAVDTQRPTHTKKQIKIDGQPKRAIDAVGRLKTVLFEPEDMELVLGSPSVRRRYLDVAISTVDRTYLRLLSQYNKILEQRNSLLKAIRELPASSRRSRLPELEYWDHELINRAGYIIAARVRFVGNISEPLREAFRSLLGDEYELRVEYDVAARSRDLSAYRIAEYKDPIDSQRAAANQLEAEINERRDEEFSRGVTAAGPHRDDIAFLLDGRPLEAFGSRGQQRLAVVALKLSEVEAIRQATGQSAVLLLDDVLSELDEIRRSRLLTRVAELGGQVIVTATDANLVQTEELRNLPLYHVRSGQLIANSNQD